MNRPADQANLCASGSRLRSKGKSHLSGAVVADKTNRVYCFASRPAGDEHFFAGQPRGLEHSSAAVCDFLRLDHPSRAHITTGLFAGRRPPDMNAPMLQGFEIALGNAVCPHGLIHRRRDGNLSGAGKDYRCQQVIGLPVSHPGHEVGCGRCNDNQVGPARQFDMAHACLGLGIQ